MRRNIYIFGACAAIFIAQPGTAQDKPSPTVAESSQHFLLWKDLYFEQRISDVLAVLSGYPEVRSVKLGATRSGKPPTLKIKLVDTKFQVFGIGFEITPEFSLAGGLQTLTLTSGSECANQAALKLPQIQGALSAKYGPEMSGASEFDNLEASSLLLRSYRSERLITRTYFYADDNIAVALVAGFNHAVRPQPVYGGGLAGSLSALALSLYDTAGEACDNSGNQRVAYALKYMPRSAFDEELRLTKDRLDKENKEASDNL